MTAARASAARLVIADDHTSLRSLLRLAFELAGFEVVGEVGNGDDALRVVDEADPDIVLMDVTMPGLDGITATRLIRERHPGTVVVMLTMHDDASLVVEAVRAGAGRIPHQGIRRRGSCRDGASAHRGRHPPLGAAGNVHAPRALV